MSIFLDGRSYYIKTGCDQAVSIYSKDDFENGNLRSGSKPLGRFSSKFRLWLSADKTTCEHYRGDVTATEPILGAPKPEPMPERK